MSKYCINNHVLLEIVLTLLNDPTVLKWGSSSQSSRDQNVQAWLVDPFQNSLEFLIHLQIPNTNMHWINLSWGPIISILKTFFGFFTKMEPKVKEVPAPPENKGLEDPEGSAGRSDMVPKYHKQQLSPLHHNVGPVALSCFHILTLTMPDKEQSVNERG